MSKWKKADIIVSAIAGIAGLIGLVTGVKSAMDEQMEEDARLEERYGLKPVETEE